MSRDKQIEEMAKDVASTQIGTVKPDLTLTELGEVYKGEFILRIAKHLYDAGYRKASDEDMKILMELKKKDVVEVRHGEWKKLYDKAPRYVCTACNHLYNNREYKFCPNCGAKMDGERKESDDRQTEGKL